MSNRERCFHCNEEVPTGTNYSLSIAGQQQPLCCRGCEAVAKTILSAGLQDYYRLRTARANTPKAGSDDLAMYDVPEIIEKFSVRQNTLWETRLSISDLHCAACAWLIETRLARLNGIASINVHLQNKTARVIWAPAQTRISEIIGAIRDLGYTTAPYSASTNDQFIQQQIDALLGRLGVAGIGMMQVVMVTIALYAGDFQDISTQMRNLLRYFSLAITTPVLLYSAQPFFTGMLRNLRNRTLGIDVPISVALIAAYVASVLATLYESPHVYYETINMFVFFLLTSRYLQLLAQRYQPHGDSVIPVAARVACEDKPGHCKWVASSQVMPGNIVVVQPGEIIPIDGEIAQGQSSVNESSVTGEFKPRSVNTADNVMAGTHNIDGTLHILAQSKLATSNISYIDQLLERALQAKPRIAKVADLIAAKFVLLVLLISAATFFYWYVQQPEIAFVTMLAVLVVSCPCALSLATPATYTAAVNNMRKTGIVVTNAAVFERAGKVSHAVFDKTGTLTAGKPVLKHTVLANGFSREQIISIAAALELHSNHPIARAFENQPKADEVSHVHVVSGQGVEGRLGDDVWRIGNAGYCFASNDSFPDQATGNLPCCADDNQIVVYLAKNRQPVAQLLLVDAIQAGVSELFDQLRSANVEIHILSGDREQNVAQIAQQLAVNNYAGGCSAESKIENITKMQQQGATVLMAGDGINDAPVIAAADLSIAMVDASELTRAQADVCLLQGGPNAIGQFFSRATQTRKILWQNFSWALAYNISALPLAAMGLIPPYLAALGMSASSILVVGNATRAGNAAKYGLGGRLAPPMHWALPKRKVING